MMPTLAAAGVEVLELDEGDADEAEELRKAYPGGVDLVVVDHYGRDAGFEQKCRSWARKILVMDDATGRVHDCDLLLDAAAPDGEAYAGRVPRHAQVLAGPAFALMRKEVVDKREEALVRRDGRPVAEILVSFGAADSWNASSSTLAALDRYVDETSITVALSARAPYVADVRGRLRGRARLVLDGDMAALMAKADLAIGAPGVSAYERAVLGLPSILVTLADNQRGICRCLSDAGAALDAGNLDRDLPVRLPKLVETLTGDAATRIRMGQNASLLIDGRGAERVMVAIAGEVELPKGARIRLRPAAADDETWLLELQRAPQTRKFFRNPSTPTAEEHRDWMQRTLSNRRTLLAVIEFASDFDGESGRSFQKLHAR